MHPAPQPGAHICFILAAFSRAASSCQYGLSWEKFKAVGMASPGTVNISAADQKDLDKVRTGFRCRWLLIPVSVHKVPGGESSASGCSGQAGRASHCSKVSRLLILPAFHSAHKHWLGSNLLLLLHLLVQRKLIFGANSFFHF